MKKYLLVSALILLIIGAWYFYPTNEAFGDATSALSPGTVVSDSTVGTVAWFAPDRAKVNDNSYTEALLGAGEISHYLKATNFGFSIPTGVTINGILVEIEEVSDDGTADDNEVKIIKSDGTLGTQNKAVGGSSFPSNPTYISYGSSSDLWGETWTAEDINDVDFGTVISAIGAGNANVDHIRITVTYVPAAGGATQVMQRSGQIVMPSSNVIMK